MRRTEGRGVPEPCKAGKHPLTGYNREVERNGTVRCRACRRERARQLRELHRQESDTPSYEQKFRERFWGRIDVGGPDDCWEWQGHRKHYGHGETMYRNRRIGAHRMAYILEVGPVDSETFVCHHCDNPPCCNPRHLFAGTAADNYRDMVNKGRRGVLPPDANRCRGEEHRSARFTEETVRECRELAAQGWSYRALARRYGVTPRAATLVARRETWKHVP
jgi:hypothetical protein